MEEDELVTGGHQENSDSDEEWINSSVEEMGLDADTSKWHDFYKHDFVK